MNWVFLKCSSYVVAVLLGYDTGFPVFQYSTVTDCHIPKEKVPYPSSCETLKT
jgi:hypothetical protein